MLDSTIPMPQPSLSDHYCTISESAMALGCKEEKIVRMLEQGDLRALVNAEYDSVLGYKRCGYVVAGPEVVLYITSQRYETVQFQTPAGKSAEATCALGSVRVVMSSLFAYQSAHAAETCNNNDDLAGMSAAELTVKILSSGQPRSHPKALPPLPGAEPSRANTKEAINVAWELENVLGRLATCDEVMERLCERANDPRVSTVFRDPAKNRKSVDWLTSRYTSSEFSRDALAAALRKWHKSRSESLTAMSPT